MIKRVILILLLILFGFNNVLIADDGREICYREKELKKIGMTIRDAILRHDAKLILKYVAKDGIPCNDGMILYSKVVKDIKNYDSWLYAYLFSADDFEKKFKTLLHPMSLEKYFKEASDIQIEVSFMDTNGEKRRDYGCLRYKSLKLEYSPELCFYLKKGKWTFTDSLYDCN